MWIVKVVVSRCPAAVMILSDWKTTEHTSNKHGVRKLNARQDGQGGTGSHSIAENEVGISSCTYQRHNLSHHHTCTYQRHIIVYIPEAHHRVHTRDISSCTYQRHIITSVHTRGISSCTYQRHIITSVHTRGISSCTTVHTRDHKRTYHGEYLLLY